MTRPADTLPNGARLPVVVRVLVPLLGLFFLIYPVGLESSRNASSAHVLFVLGGAASFVAVFLWLFWRHEPLQLTPAEPSKVLKVCALILILAGLAGALIFAFGVEWRMLFFYHLNVAAGLMLLRRDAYVAILGIAVLTFILGFPLGLAFLAAPVIAVGLWSTSFVRQVAVAEELSAARDELARLAVAEERLRFARDLHDLLGHSLSLVTLKSELAERLLPDTAQNAAARREIRDLQNVARSALTKVREAVSGYRQPSLEEELAGAHTMLEAAEIACTIHNELMGLPDKIEAILTWVVREGVTNVVRHSGAASCKIRLTQEGSFIHADIKDDGNGKSTSDFVRGNGLIGLAERLEASGGHLDAGLLPEGGFKLRASLPLGDGGAGPRALAATTFTLNKDGRS